MGANFGTSPGLVGIKVWLVGRGLANKKSVVVIFFQYLGIRFDFENKLAFLMRLESECLA